MSAGDDLFDRHEQACADYANAETAKEFRLGATVTSEAVTFKDPVQGPTITTPRYGGIIGWWCPIELRFVDIDHFHYPNDGYDHTPMPTLMLDAILKDYNNADHYHNGPCESYSLGTGCPREALLSRFVGVRPSPVSFNSIQWGKAVHKYLESIDNGGWWHEYPIPNEGMEPATLFDGIPIWGTVDRLKKDFTEMEDYKCQGDRAYTFHINKQPGVVKAEHAAQLNVYSMMLKKLFDKEPKSMRVWYGCMTASGMAPWDRCDVPRMSEEQIASIRPGGGVYTFGQIIHIVHAAFKDIRKLLESKDLQAKELVETVKGMVEQIPFVGESMYGKKKCEKYCICPGDCANIGYVVDGVKHLPPVGKHRLVSMGKRPRAKGWLESEMDRQGVS